ERAGNVAALVYATMPAVSASSAIASTDALLAPCWALAFYGVVRALAAKAQPSIRWWAATGVAIGVGVLAKYAMLYFAGSLALYLAVDRGRRRELARGFALACAVAAAICAPNVAWNLAHGGVTVRRTVELAHLGRAPIDLRGFSSFACAQLA